MQIIKSANEEDDYISEKILNIIIDLEGNADNYCYVIEMIEFSPYETGYVQSYLKILNDYIKTFNNSSVHGRMDGRIFLFASLKEQITTVYPSN